MCVVPQGGDFKRDDAAKNAIMFSCPCGTHTNLIAFEPTIGGAPPSPSGLTSDGHPWKRESGETIDDLTLSPSVLMRGKASHVDGKLVPVECWHGFIRAGVVTSV